MIPVLGVPVLNRPELVYQMLDSVDVEVGRIVIIDNGGVVAPNTVSANERIIRPGQNLGVAASWNFIIQTTPDAPWWAIVNFDIAFAPGDLERLSQHMDMNKGPMVALLGTYSAFAVSREAIGQVGFFDENFHPAYFEDNDFDYRRQLVGVPAVNLPAGMTHVISSTIASSEGYRDENYRTFGSNSDYYKSKWGGSPHHERFTTPFDSSLDIRFWHLDISRLASQSWRMDMP